MPDSLRWTPVESTGQSTGHPTRWTGLMESTGAVAGISIGTRTKSTGEQRGQGPRCVPPEGRDAIAARTRT
jgi:hypothetical protein